MDEVAHRQMLDVVQFLLRAGEIEEQFAVLLQQTLAWDPRRRISTSEVLNHPCWSNVLGSIWKLPKARADGGDQSSTSSTRAVAVNLATSFCRVSTFMTCGVFHPASLVLRCTRPPSHTAACRWRVCCLWANRASIALTGWQGR